MQNNQPLFTSASGFSQDEFDLGEVFAEYFSNEFDLDPLNAYTNSMANYSGMNAPSALPPAAMVHAPALQQNANGAPPGGSMTKTAGPQPGTGQVGSNMSSSSGSVGGTTDGASGSFAKLGLPTGGIKTAFHVGSATPSRPAGVIVPPQKKCKTEEQEQQQPPTTVNPGGGGMFGLSNHNTDAIGGPVAALALAHQQATAAAAGQDHQSQLAAAAAQAMNMQQQAAALFVVSAAAINSGGFPVPTAPGSNNQVSLPVGVGIRLGGLGGIAPATAEATARPPVLQSQYASALWGPFAAAMGGMPGGVFGTSPDQAVAERRQRNREHAKRSRVRKKFMLESMQEQVKSLQLENQNLRLLVQEHLPEHATSIFSECCATSPLFGDGTGSEDDGSTKLGKTDFSLMQSLTSGQRCFVLSDPKLPDNPIVFASADFYKMTGYTPKEVLGRNCRFLQGPGTDPRSVEVIRKAIAMGADATVCLLNYKADGTPFWNQFFIAALRDSDNCIVNYVGVQCEVEPEQGDSAVEEKVNEVLPLANKNDEGKSEED